MVSALTLVLFVAAAAAFERSDFTVDTLIKRQEGSSGAQFECHSDCGHTILDASADNCDNSTWTELLENCQECANTYNILRHYGDSVESAAEECGLSVTFSPSGGSSSESAPAETSSAAASSTATHDDNAATTAVPSSGDTATATPGSTTASGIITPSPASNTSTSATDSATPPPIEESTGSGMKFGISLGAALLAGLAFAVAI